MLQQPDILNGDTGWHKIASQGSSSYRDKARRPFLCYHAMHQVYKIKKKKRRNAICGIKRYHVCYRPSQCACSKSPLSSSSIDRNVDRSHITYRHVLKLRITKSDQKLHARLDFPARFSLFSSSPGSINRRNAQ